jgi:hypothetical protein
LVYLKYEQEERLPDYEEEAEEVVRNESFAQ